MISLSEVESIHEILIEKFGGSKGIRDREILESAINRPYQTFDQNELYPLPVDKAAAIFESLISNHPFIDGNKRTAYVVMRLILLGSNLDIYADQKEKYEFVMSAAKSEIKFDKIREWLTKHLR
ncbi:MAG TPA: type II toxin-antitoxin system death-on-curing family toxin [Chryseolinea sp.]|nr:type II toxin-antitoxin system death-on-curing family toxin [Chryseolinea sp.]